MSRISKSIAVFMSTLALAAFGYVPTASAAATVPQTLTQQGRLLDNTGAAVDGVQLTFTFSLYTAASGGTAIWAENQSITPDNGYFSAKLGDVTAFTPTLFDGSQGTLYLGVKIGSDAEMAPRQELTSVPFALLALNALSATHATVADKATLADTATNANKAATATTADNATNATNATTATNAISANTVKSITTNFVSKSGNLSGTVSLACDANTVIVGGFCLPQAPTNAYVSQSGISGKGNLSYVCSCLPAGCTGVAGVACAK